jgi:hypothetical protein
VLFLSVYFNYPTAKMMCEEKRSKKGRHFILGYFNNPNNKVYYSMIDYYIAGNYCVPSSSCSMRLRSAALVTLPVVFFSLSGVLLINLEPYAACPPPSSTRAPSPSEEVFSDTASSSAGDFSNSACPSGAEGVC